MTFAVWGIVMIMFNDDLLDHTGAILSRSEGIILLCFFVIYLIYIFGLSRIVVSDKPEIELLSLPRSIIDILVALAMLLIGGKLVIDNALNMAGYFGMSEKVAGLTILALGTSLPELATSAVAAYRHKPEIAIGNVVGSNIFNIFFILGLSALIRPIPAPASYNSDLAVLIVASGLLFLIMFTGQKHTLDRWEAGIFLILYIAYIAALVIW